MPVKIVVVSDAGFASIFDRMPGAQLKSGDAEVQAENDAPHVVAALQKLKHDVRHAVLGKKATEDLRKVVEGAPDLVVNLCDSVQGDPQLAPLVPAFLAAHGVRHTGGDAGATALCKRKHDVKAVLVREGLPTPRYQVVHVDDASFSLALTPPVILKLCGEHASVGIDPSSVCFTEAEAQQKARSLLQQFRQPILVEEYVAGREFYVSCVGRPLKHLPLMEHHFSGLALRTFEKKWMEQDPKNLDPRFADPVPHRAPAAPFVGDLDDVGELCARALHVVGWRDWGRCDVRIDKGGVPLIIDVTPMTYLHPDAPCPLAAKAAGVSYVSFWQAILDGATTSP